MLSRCRHKRISFPSKAENITKVVRELATFFKAVGQVDEYALSLSLTEAVANAIIHGNKSDPSKRVVISVSTQPECLTIQVGDEGQGFDPQQLQDPTRQENLLKLGGRGIFFIRRFMDEVTFNTCGNEITMVKYLN